MSQQNLWDLLQITILQSSPKERMRCCLKMPVAYIITPTQPFHLMWSSLLQVANTLQTSLEVETRAPAALTFHSWADAETFMKLHYCTAIPMETRCVHMHEEGIKWTHT